MRDTEFVILVSLDPAETGEGEHWYPDRGK